MRMMSRLAYNIFLALSCLLLLLLTNEVNCQKEGDRQVDEPESPTTVSEGGGDSEETCSDKESCLALELDQWFQKLDDKKFQLDCSIDEPSESASASAVKPLYEIVDCNSKGAVWQYRYAGAKGKRRIMHGKGKLSFTRLGNPPHGYDYGMKSGICFSFGADVDAVQLPFKSIEGHFDNGVPDGEAETTDFDGRSTKSLLVRGVVHGFARRYEKVVDKDTKLDKGQVRLHSVAVYRRGVQFGHEWTLRDDGVRLLRTVGDGSGGADRTFAIVPMNGTRDGMNGLIYSKPVVAFVIEFRCSVKLHMKTISFLF